jgi:CRISPR-associated protein Cas2
MHVVLCYDVAKNRRRARLFRRLKRYLAPVQKSVFEGRLDPTKLDRLLGLVQREIDMETDTVRIYLLCGGCRSSSLLVGTARPCLDDDDPRIP